MEIKLKLGYRDEWQVFCCPDGSRIEDVYRHFKDKIPYSIFAANVNNEYKDLNYKLKEADEVVLLDIRTQAANYVYQCSLTLLLLRAVDEVWGKKSEITIQNSLNKGLYIEVEKRHGLSDEDVSNLDAKMRELVEKDLPIKLEIVGRSEAMKILSEEGMDEKKRLLREDLELKFVRFYTLDGYRDFFYSLMVPSTGYLKFFELRKYRKGMLMRFPHQTMPDQIPEFKEENQLYRTFAEQKIWDGLLDIHYVSDLNEKIETKEYMDLMLLSEALHEKKISQIADDIKRQKKRIVLIAGPSSSGKTTFARRLCIQLRVNGLSPLYMGTDDYFVERADTPLDEYGEPDFENLRSLDIDLFNSDMNGLLSGKEVDLPTFDFMTGTKVFGKRKTSVNSDQPIVIEGIHALNDELTPFIPHDQKYKIYISPLTQLNIDPHNRVPTTDERMLRRMVRDSQFRGHDAKSTIANWHKVRAAEDRNIFPYTDEANVLFNSYHIYEIAVLKKYAKPLLEKITPEDDEYAEARRLLKFLEFFREIDDDEVIVNNSIIREFIGGSIFVD